MGVLIKIYELYLETSLYSMMSDTCTYPHQPPHVTHSHIHTYVHTHANTHIHITHTHTHTHTHLHTCTPSPLPHSHTCTQVVNYNMSATVKQYIHRVGRTARAGRSGR